VPRSSLNDGYSDCNKVHNAFMYVLGHELIPYDIATHHHHLLVVLVGPCWGDRRQKSLSLQIGWNEINFGRIVLQINTHRIVNLTSHFQDGGHDIISRRKVQPSGEYTRSVRPTMQRRPPAAR